MLAESLKNWEVRLSLKEDSVGRKTARDSPRLGRRITVVAPRTEYFDPRLAKRSHLHLCVAGRGPTLCTEYSVGDTTAMCS